MFTSLRMIAFSAGLLAFIGLSYAADVPKPPTSDEKSRAVQLCDKMRNGSMRLVNLDDRAETTKNKEAVKTFARYYVLTLATPPYNGEPVPKGSDLPKTLGVDYTVTFLADFLERYCDLPLEPGTTKISVPQADFGNELGLQVTAAAKEILANSARPAELINAVRFMAIAAKLPCPDMATTFVEIINNPKISDAMKLYAFQGLRKQLEQYDLIEPTKHIIGTRDETKLALVTDALSNYILQKRTPVDAREAQVIQYVRTEAVAALARCRVSIIRKANNTPISRPGWTLARVFAADPNVFPPFTNIERAEAAMGFAQMKIDKETNLDVAAYYIAVALQAFTQQMVQDYKAVNESKAAMMPVLPQYPWKIYAARWSYAFATWRENSKSFKSSENVKSLADLAIAEILSPIEKQAERAAVTTDKIFGAWPQANAPKAWAEMKAAVLYNDDPTSILPIAVNAKLTTPDPKANTPKTPDPKMVDPKTAPPKMPDPKGTPKKP